MKCIDLYTKDTYFNLAAEEYLMKQSDEPFFMLYVNDPSVVVGKHQNACAEVNRGYLEEQGIRLARRVSGGGTVYHDAGNLNFSFITNEQAGDLINFRKYTRPVINALEALGLKANLGKRNEILLDGRKITGTASHVFKHRVLHHGTLLFDADRTALSRSLEAGAGKYEDKAVKSVRSKITNIREHLREDLSNEQFFRFIFDHVRKGLPGHSIYTYTEQDLRSIRLLADEKYRTWDWIYGYSPRYRLSGVLEKDGTTMHILLDVQKGRVEKAEIRHAGREMSDWGSAVTGARHEPEELYGILKQLTGLETGGLTKEDVLNGFF